MKAVSISEFGPPDVLQLREDLPVPSPAPGETLVRVSYAAVNPIDWKTRRGIGWLATQLKSKLPRVLGFDLAGTVAEDNDHHRAGQRVCGTAKIAEHGGSYAQLAVCNGDSIAAVPEGVDLETAAALPIAGLTAWMALDAANCTTGSSLLILGGAGGVGHVACQLARMRGADVNATASSRNREFIRGLGATPIDYAASELPQGAFDGIVDLVGGEVGERAVSALKPDGVMVTVPTVSAETVIEAAHKEGKKAVGMIRRQDRGMMETMLDMVSDGRLSVTVDHRFELGDLAAAHALSESGHVRGKIVVRVG